MKKIVLILISLTLCLSCISNKKSERENKNIEIVNTLFKHFNNHDWEAMASLYHIDAEFKDPAYGIGVFKKTRKETVNHYTGLNQMFPDVKDEVVQLYPSGKDKVIVEFVSTGTSNDGEKFKLPICAIITIKNGLITKDYVYYDNF